MLTELLHILTTFVLFYLFLNKYQVFVERWCALSQGQPHGQVKVCYKTSCQQNGHRVIFYYVYHSKNKFLVLEGARYKYQLEWQYGSCLFVCMSVCLFVCLFVFNSGKKQHQQHCTIEYQKLCLIYIEQINSHCLIFSIPIFDKSEKN